MIHLTVTTLVFGLLISGPVGFAQSGTWQPKADLPTARLGLAACAVNGKIYAMGGYAAAGEPGLKTVEAYDPATDTWTQKADLPTGRRWLAASVVNGKIYAIGGFRNNATPGLPTVEMYDPATDTWTSKADLPTPRKFLTASVVDGLIYAMGGMSSGGGLAPLRTVEAYDPQTDAWTRKADLPTARIMLSSSVVNGKIYAMGGTVQSNPTLATVEEYNPATDTWIRKENLLSENAGISTSSVGGFIYAIGGAHTSSGPTSFYLDVYDVGKGVWTRSAARMRESRWALSTAVVGGRVYAIGGAHVASVPHPGVATVEEFNPAGQLEPLVLHSIQYNPEQFRITIRGSGTPQAAYSLYPTRDFRRWSPARSVFCDAKGGFIFEEPVRARYGFYSTVRP